MRLISPFGRLSRGVAGIRGGRSSATRPVHRRAPSSRSTPSSTCYRTRSDSCTRIRPSTDRQRSSSGRGRVLVHGLGVVLAATRSAEQGVVDLPETEVGDRLEIRFDLEGRDDVSAASSVRSRISARCSTSARPTERVHRRSTVESDATLSRLPGTGLRGRRARSGAPRSSGARCAANRRSAISGLPRHARSRADGHIGRARGTWWSRPRNSPRRPADRDRVVESTLAVVADLLRFAVGTELDEGRRAWLGVVQLAIAEPHDGFETSVFDTRTCPVKPGGTAAGDGCRSSRRSGTTWSSGADPLPGVSTCAARP